MTAPIYPYPPEDTAQRHFFKSTDGYFIAWSLLPPGHDFGEWSLVALRDTKATFVRALSAEEIQCVCDAPFLWWGTKLANTHWALVTGVPSESVRTSTYTHTTINPLHKIGV